ncbi:MAG: hypothetical protein IPM26_13260 [Saprospiraceae bacterium]|nr:hypothetical protein [Saprospiraceae bacterium]
MINHKQYHFLVVAYAHNNWQEFDDVTGQGQRRAYLEGRGNIGGPEKRPYTFVPRPIGEEKSISLRRWAWGNLHIREGNPALSRTGGWNV